MLGRFREQYQMAIKPVGIILAKIGFTPNMMTVLSLVVAIAGGIAYAFGGVIVGALLIIVTGVVDMFDGAIARATRSETRFGATFDHVLDRYAEFFIVFGIVFSGYSQWSIGFITLFGMVMASFTRAKAESVGGLKSCTVGLAERQEKLLLLILGSILTGIFRDALSWSVIIVGILSHITVAQRLYFTWIQTGGK
jgi:CDP-diacylglycerol--glycerol-3-phosphate 3-phosphatidyltransferase/archaetidylinositol phosphate synthase